MSKISWLHLSDLHLGRDVYNEKIVLEKLLADIKTQIEINNIELNLVFITGDLTFSGQKEEFDHVQEFIGELLIVTKLNKDDVVLVPGNHDVNHNQVLSIARNSKKLLNNRDAISEIIGNETERDIYTQGLKNYYEFIENNFSWAKAGKKNALSYTINKKLNGTSVSILSLNTAWLAYGNENEKGKIVLGERQVREAFDEIDNAQIIVALMHHPFEWLEWFDSNDVKKMLERRADFILNGHEHRLDVIGKGSIFGKAFKISAGSTYEMRNHVNSYNIVDSDISNGVATCFFRRFVDQDGGFWSEDNTLDNSVSNGKIRIKLSERMAEEFSIDSREDKYRNQEELWVNPVDSKIQLFVPDMPKDLINRIRDGKCILFAGAGTSLDAGLPSWYDLLKGMVEQVDDYGGLDNRQKEELVFLIEQQDFNVVAEFCKEQLGAKGFADLIREKLGTRCKNSIIHNILAEIPFKGAITSNYDNFIEKNHRNYRVILPNDINKFDQVTIQSLFEEDMFPIFKIHGSYDDSNSIILTDNDYRNVIFRQPQYRENLKQLFKDKSLLFVGFSFRDSSINLLLQEIFTVTDGMTNPHYAFISDIGSIKKDFFWKSRNIRVIPYQTVDGTHIILNKMLEKIRDEFK